MGTITLPNFRVTADVEMNTRLKDGGVYIDWAGLSNIKAWLYSDAQKAIAGRCDVSIDQTDSTKLVCEYSATKPQYLGVNRLIVQGEYMGRTKTYDKPVFNFVRWTDDQAGEELVIDDPIVDVEISVEDVSSSLIERLIAACIKATEEAQEVVDTSRGPRGFSAYEVAVQNGFEGTEEEWLLSLQGKSAYEIAVELGYEGTEEQWIASLKGEDGDPGTTPHIGQNGNWFIGDTDTEVLARGTNGVTPHIGDNGHWYIGDTDTEVVAEGQDGADGEDGADGVTPAISIGTVTTVEPGTPASASMTGTPAAPVLNLSIPKGLVGATPNITVGTVTTGQPGTPVVVTITGTPEAPVLNITIPQGMQGNTGSSVDYPYELVNNLTTNDATKGLSAAQGVVLDGKVSQLEAEVHNLSGKYYGVFADESDLPDDAVTPGYAFVGTESPFSVWNFDGEEWSDSGAIVNGIQGEPGVGFGSIFTPVPYDGTVIIVLSDNNTITLDLNHTHPDLYSKILGGAQPAGGFLPDVVYSLGTLSGTITFTLASPVTGNVNHYFWMFDTDSTAPTITWPAGLTWAAGSAPTVAASKHYEVSILGGIAYYSEV